MPQPVSILVLTEDSGVHGPGTARAAVKQLLQLVDSRLQTQYLVFEPVTSEAAEAMRANAWDGKRAHQRRVSLVRAVATKLLEQPAAFVVFHYDGDRQWTTRPSPRDQTFDVRVRTAVRRHLQQHLKDEAAAEDALSRLLTMVPFYSIEAWCFQNLTLLRKLCGPQCAGHLAERFDGWEQDRTSIDEVTKPKDVVPIGSRENLRLLRERYPRGAAREAGASLSAAVDAFEQCGALRSALRRTWSYP